MSESRPNYTDEEIFTIIELQLGFPTATNPNRTVHKKALPPQQPRSEGEYYNDLTEILFMLMGGEMGAGPRINEVRKKFYAKHGITVFDQQQSSPFNAYLDYKRGGAFDFELLKR